MWFVTPTILPNSLPGCHKVQTCTLVLVTHPKASRKDEMCILLFVIIFGAIAVCM